MCQLKIEVVRKNALPEVILNASAININFDIVTIEYPFGADKVLYGFHVHKVDCLRNSIAIKEDEKLSVIETVPSLNLSAVGTV